MTTTSVTRLGSEVLGPEIPVVPDDHPYRTEFRRWLDANVPGEPEPLAQDPKLEFRQRWQARLAGAGWAGPSWPKEYGGRGSGALEQYMYYEELALARAPENLNQPGIILLGPTLMAHGTHELKARFLPGILSAEEVWCQGFSEPNAGSDLAALRTRARLEGDEWVIDGQKIWTTFAQYSDYCFLLCRTEEGSERHRGLTMLIVPMDLPGITVRPIEQMSGDDEFAEVFFDGVRSPRELTVGEPGDGWKVSMTMFQFERSDIGFTGHGRLLVRLHDTAAALRAARDAGAVSDTAWTTARLKVGELWGRCQELRRLNLTAALHAEGGGQIGAAGSVPKLVWSELEQAIAAFDADVHGAEGLLTDREWTKNLLDSRAVSIFSGTSEIQRNIVAERLLGLPRA